MPSDTFAKLPAKKKKAIFSAAVEEFAARSFSQASINQVVRTAGISRGSFYQYFQDKEDLYMYVLGEIAKEKMAVAVATRDLNSDADFFQVYRAMFLDILAWAETQPQYHRISMLMDYDDSQFIARLREEFSGNWKFFNHLIERDKERGRIRRDVDVEMVTEILFAFNKHFFQEYWHTGSREKLIYQMEETLKILKGGIASV